MQNEPNLGNARMNVTKVLTTDYDKRTLGIRGKNEPKTNPIYSLKTQYLSRRSFNEDGSGI